MYTSTLSLIRLYSMKRIYTLNFLYPPFLNRVVRGVKAARAAGIELGVFETLRSYDRQVELYAKGRTTPGPIVTRSRPGRSWHTYGVAVDLVPLVNGKWSWEYPEIFTKAAPYLEGQGLQWLGRDPKLVDMAHYQLPVDASVYEIEALYKKEGLIGVWHKFNKRYGDKELWN